MKNAIRIALLIIASITSVYADVYKQAFEPNGHILNAKTLNKYCSGNTVCERNLMIFAFEAYIDSQFFRPEKYGKPCYYKMIERERNKYISRKFEVPLDKVNDWRKEQIETQLNVKYSTPEWTIGKEMDIEMKILAQFEGIVVDEALDMIKNGNKGKQLFPPCEN